VFRVSVRVSDGGRVSTFYLSVLADRLAGKSVYKMSCVVSSVMSSINVVERLYSPRASSRQVCSRTTTRSVSASAPRPRLNIAAGRHGQCHLYAGRLEWPTTRAARR